MPISNFYLPKAANTFTFSFSSQNKDAVSGQYAKLEELLYKAHNNAASILSKNYRPRENAQGRTIGLVQTERFGTNMPVKDIPVILYPWYLALFFGTREEQSGLSVAEILRTNYASGADLEGTAYIKLVGEILEDERERKFAEVIAEFSKRDKKKYNKDTPAIVTEVENRLKAISFGRICSDSTFIEFKSKLQDIRSLFLNGLNFSVEYAAALDKCQDFLEFIKVSVLPEGSEFYKTLIEDKCPAAEIMRVVRKFMNYVFIYCRSIISTGAYIEPTAVKSCAKTPRDLLLTAYPDFNSAGSDKDETEDLVNFFMDVTFTERLQALVHEGEKLDSIIETKFDSSKNVLYQEVGHYDIMFETCLKTLSEISGVVLPRRKMIVDFFSRAKEFYKIYLIQDELRKYVKDLPIIPDCIAFGRSLNLPDIMDGKSKNRVVLKGVTHEHPIEIDPTVISRDVTSFLSYYKKVIEMFESVIDRFYIKSTKAFLPQISYRYSQNMTAGEKIYWISFKSPWAKKFMIYRSCMATDVNGPAKLKEIKLQDQIVVSASSRTVAIDDGNVPLAAWRHEARDLTSVGVSMSTSGIFAMTKAEWNLWRLSLCTIRPVVLDEERGRKWMPVLDTRVRSVFPAQDWIETPVILRINDTLRVTSTEIMGKDNLTPSFKEIDSVFSINDPVELLFTFPQHEVPEGDSSVLEAKYRASFTRITESFVPRGPAFTIPHNIYTTWATRGDFGHVSLRDCAVLKIPSVISGMATVNPAFAEDENTLSKDKLTASRIKTKFKSKTRTFRADIPVDLTKVKKEQLLADVNLVDKAEYDTALASGKDEKEAGKVILWKSESLSPDRKSPVYQITSIRPEGCEGAVGTLEIRGQLLGREDEGKGPVYVAYNPTSVSIQGVRTNEFTMSVVPPVGGIDWVYDIENVHQHIVKFDEDSRSLVTCGPLELLTPFDHQVDNLNFVSSVIDVIMSQLLGNLCNDKTAAEKAIIGVSVGATFGRLADYIEKNFKVADGVMASSVEPVFMKHSLLDMVSHMRSIAEAFESSKGEVTENVISKINDLLLKDLGYPNFDQCRKGIGKFYALRHFSSILTKSGFERAANDALYGYERICCSFNAVKSVELSGLPAWVDSGKVEDILHMLITDMIYSNQVAEWEAL